MNHFRSKKWSAFALTLLALVILALVGAPAEALEYLALAVALGLPALLGGQSIVDMYLARRNVPPTVRVEPRASAPPPSSQGPPRLDGG